MAVGGRLEPVGAAPPPPHPRQAAPGGGGAGRRGEEAGLPLSSAPHKASWGPEHRSVPPGQSVPRVAVAEVNGRCG